MYAFTFAAFIKSTDLQYEHKKCPSYKSTINLP